MLDEQDRPETTTIQPGRLFSGDEANERVRDLATRRAQKIACGDAVDSGIPFVDANNPPLTRGDMSVIIGMTSEGKSMLATSMAKHTIAQIKAGQRSQKSAVVVALTEETIEARRIQLWGDHRVSIKNVLTGTVPMQFIEENIAKAAGEPLYFIGDSSTPDTDLTKDDTFGALTVRRIALSVQTLVRAGVAPELLIIDHAHDLSSERDLASEQETYEQVARALVRLSSWLRQWCPVVVVCQAKKEVMQRPAKDRQPTKYDLSYMAAVARRARDIYSIWYPKGHIDEGATIRTAKGTVQVASGVFMVNMVKARFGSIVNKPFAMTAADSEGRWSHYLREMGQ